ncbi:MAG TPA: hypothetical protein VFB63_19080 [Bryobacteraceae bacterium]|nr:hypothetical protein [Bryobacteraceae bacterium]
MRNAHAIHHRDERFQWSIPCPSAHTRERTVHTRGAILNGGNRIRRAKREIVMRVHASLRLGVEHFAKGLEPLRYFMREQCTSRIDDIDTMRAIGLHLLGLLSEQCGRQHVRHHQEADGIHPHSAGMFNVLFGNIGLRTVRSDTDAPSASFVGQMNIFNGADTRQQQRRHACMVDILRHGGNPFRIAMGAETVGATRSGEAIPVRNLDGVHASGVQRLGDHNYLLDRVLVPNGMHSIAQRHVLDKDLV